MRQITVVDFKDYLQRVAEPYRFLAANRPATNGTSSGQHTDTHDGEDACGAGATASCSSCTSCSSCSSSCAHAEEAQLEGVPPICFRGDFDLTVPETFETFSPADEGHSTMIMVERLSNYLDQARRGERRTLRWEEGVCCAGREEGAALAGRRRLRWEEEGCRA
eukprot:2241147-Pleurochrysis_carterae.AAC.5